MRATTSAIRSTKKGRRTMSTWLSEREQRLVAGAEAASAPTPIPTQIVSNGEYLPPPQSATQKRVEARINELADLNGKHLGLSRRQFLHTSCGMAAAFLAMNDIYGNVFQVAPAEACEPELMLTRARPRRPVHLRRPDPFRARRLRSQGAFGSGGFCELTCKAKVTSDVMRGVVAVHGGYWRSGSKGRAAVNAVA